MPRQGSRQLLGIGGTITKLGEGHLQVTVPLSLQQGGFKRQQFARNGDALFDIQ